MLHSQGAKVSLSDLCVHRYAPSLSDWFLSPLLGGDYTMLLIQFLLFYLRLLNPDLFTGP